MLCQGHCFSDSRRKLYISKYRQLFHMCSTVTINHMLGNSGSWNPSFRETGLKLLVPKKRLWKAAFFLKACFDFRMTWGKWEWDGDLVSQGTSCVHAPVLEVPLWYISPPSEGFTGQIVRGVESDKRNASLHICFTSKIHKQNVLSQPLCRSIPSAFIKIDLPFEALCSLKWWDFSLQKED